MAAVQERNGNYRILFNYRGKQRAFTLGRVAESEAKAKASQVDYLLITTLSTEPWFVEFVERV